MKFKQNKEKHTLYDDLQIDLPQLSQIIVIVMLYVSIKGDTEVYIYKQKNRHFKNHFKNTNIATKLKNKKK